jgi:hypothetical protein
VNATVDVKALQFLKVDAKFITLTFVSNILDGHVVNERQLLKAELKEAASVFVVNNPDGIDAILVKENISENIVVIVEKENISDGIDVTPVERMKLANVSMFDNPLYPPGIDVIEEHP